MFKLVSRDHNYLYQVLDTNDGVVESYTIEQLQYIIEKTGIEIEGLISFSFKDSNIVLAFDEILYENPYFLVGLYRGTDLYVFYKVKGFIKDIIKLYVGLDNAIFIDYISNTMSTNLNCKSSSQDRIKIKEINKSLFVDLGSHILECTHNRLNTRIYPIIYEKQNGGAFFIA